jgi:hypothetical protein
LGLNESVLAPFSGFSFDVVRAVAADLHSTVPRDISVSRIRGYTRDAAIRPNAPDRLRAEFSLFSLLLALLLINKTTLPASFVTRNEAGNRQFCAFGEIEKTVANESRRLATGRRAVIDAKPLDPHEIHPIDGAYAPESSDCFEQLPT